MPRWAPFEQRFWSFVQKGDGCWEWCGSIDSKGYGRIVKDGRRIGAHRVMHEMVNGKNPGELCVCHHCDNPLCVNPDHLFLGTHSDNMQDCTNKGRNNLVNHPELISGDRHWTRKSTLQAKEQLKKISERRKAEWATGRRQAIRDAKGRILGTRMVEM